MHDMSDLKLKMNEQFSSVSLVLVNLMKKILIEFAVVCMQVKVVINVLIWTN